jgi:hypothetical protein
VDGGGGGDDELEGDDVAALTAARELAAGEQRQFMRKAVVAVDGAVDAAARDRLADPVGGGEQVLRRSCSIQRAHPDRKLRKHTNAKSRFAGGRGCERLWNVCNPTDDAFGDSVAVTFDIPSYDPIENRRRRKTRAGLPARRSRNGFAQIADGFQRVGLSFSL